MLNERIKELAKLHEDDNVNQIVLKYANDKDVDTKILANQLIGRNKAKGKIPTWAKADIAYPVGLSMEQSSSEEAAEFKATIAQGATLADLTGGFGVDTYFMGQMFQEVDYFETNKELSEIAAYNFKELGAKHIEVHNEDSLAYLQNTSKTYDWIFVDPARRGKTQNRVFLLEDCTPDISANIDTIMAKTDNLLVKLSPILDIRTINEQLPHVAKIWVVAIKNECKEILVHCKKGYEKAPKTICVNMLSEELQEVYDDSRLNKKAKLRIGFPQLYLYEPNRAILKGNLQDELAKELYLTKLAAYSNFFTSDEHIEDFPGRVFEYLAQTNAKEKSIKPYLKKGKANVIARNFPMKASQIYTKFKITPGTNRYFLATTLSNGKKVVLVTERLK